MNFCRKIRDSYVSPDLFQLPLELEKALLECSVRVNLNDLEVEPYHDYFYENNKVTNEGDPWKISFGE